MFKILLLLTFFTKAPDPASDCDQYYTANLKGLAVNGEVVEKRTNAKHYEIRIMNKDKSISAVSFLKNSKGREIYSFVAVKDVFVKNKDEVTIRVGHFQNNNVNVKLFDTLCD